MKKDDITVVICCAGMGTRLGIGSTKALINIDGKPLIIRILENLDEYDDIRIVVGFQAEKLIKIVNEFRKDVLFVFNYDYEKSGIVESLSKASSFSRKYIVEIDGDLIINKDDLNEFLEYPEECLGINDINSENPIYAKVENCVVTHLSEEYGDYEWTGLVKLKTDKINKNFEHIHEMIQPCLPMKYIKIRAKDIDTPEDFESAISWYEENC